MIQLVYSNRIIISGKSKEVSLQLKELANKYATIKELLNSYFPDSAAPKTNSV